MKNKTFEFLWDLRNVPNELNLCVYLSMWFYFSSHCLLNTLTEKLNLENDEKSR